jgi:hypothetical protein
MSYAGLGQVTGGLLGRDTLARHEAGGAVRVSSRWAQRAVNSGNRYNNPSAALIAVDGHAGPITIAALRVHSHQFSSDQPVTNDPPGTRVTDTVIIPVALETRLASLPSVPSPTAAAATHHATTSSGASGGAATGGATVAPIPGAPPAETPADTVILDEGSSGGGGLIARYGIMPWAIGGVALVGLGLWFMMGSGAGASVRANRRRVRRNSCHHGKSVEDHREDFGYAIRSAMYFHKLGSNDQAREYALKAEEEAACLQPLPAGQQARLDAVLRTVKGVTRNYNYEYTSHPGSYDTRGRPTRNPARPLSEIASEIRRDWKNVYFGAVPYLEAMGTLDSVRDNYGADRGDSIVAYFLGNATGWRGPTAKRVKAELNAALKERRR